MLENDENQQKRVLEPVKEERLEFSGKEKDLEMGLSIEFEDKY
jgi:hypothetical protein